EAGQMEIRDNVEFSLPRVLTDCMTIASSGGKEGLKSETVLPAPPFRVVGDDTRVKQIFINLLSNAHKFTAQGAVRIILDEAKEIDGGKVLVKVAVEDTGVGIDEDKLKDLFQPFKQVHGSSYSGTGMGLYISRSLARVMGGDIEVSSRKGEGTRFTVTLKLKKGSLEAEAAAKEKASEEASTGGLSRNYQRLRVLMAEDVELNVALAMQVFSRFFGFTPEVAVNGLEALEKARSTAYDLIFMDVQMPKMGGIEATQKIRALGIRTPIVAMTANALAADVEAAKAAGMDDYITKPIQHALIGKVLARLFPEGASVNRSEKRAS
ncbi:MAG TPA: ATP-binding protein, partial [Bdellovibrionota bacterium]|nr:ATP-binding protein [Bdellovibrionota bacterium]